MPKKRVVIIGGGFAGSVCAKKLMHDFEVTLIDTKDYFEFTPSILRTIIKPQLITKIRKPHRKYLPDTQIIIGNVTEVGNDTVQVNNAARGFDYLIIASGAVYGAILSGNGIRPSGGSELMAHAEKLQQAQNVLIVGGGLVGVELAGEITEFYPAKKVTLVHSGNMILERNHPTTRAVAMKFLQRRGVIIEVNCAITACTDGKFTANSGKMYRPDISFICTGITPNTAFLQKHYAAVLAKNKSVAVNEYLAVKGYSHLFALGDANAIPEEKTAQSAEKQAELVCENLRRLQKNKELKTYAPKKRPMIISLGKYHAIFEYKDVVWFGKLPALLKYGVEVKTMLKHKM